MRTKALILLVLGLFAFGCGTKTKTITNSGPSDASNGGGTGTPDGGGTGQTDGGGTTGSADIVAPDPSKEKACPEATPHTGKGWPFEGMTYTPDTEKSHDITYDFTCTMCPGGTLGIDGKYAYYEGGPPRNEWKETWEFSGNRFWNHIKAIDSFDGQEKELFAEGFYFCPDPKELGDIESKNYWNVVVIYTDAKPAGAFGVEPGVADLCFLAVNAASGAKDVAYACNFFWDPAGTWQSTDLYCKVGQIVNGRECADPFGP